MSDADRGPGWDQQEIARVTNDYFGGDRKMLANSINADTNKHNWQLSISQDICRKYGSIEKFSELYPLFENAIWPTNRSVYITSFWGWRPETWACVGFATEGRRNTYLRETTDPFIMVVFITETAPTDEPELRGKVVGFYEISHEVGSREEFTDKSHHGLEPGKWPYSLRAIRAFSFLPEFQLDIRALIPDYGRSNATSIGAHGAKLTEDQIAKLRALPFEQKPVFGGGALISEDVLFAEPRKGRTRAGAINRSGFSVPGEPIDTPKELYILRLSGDTTSFLGRPSEGKSIYKVGLSMSPKRRLGAFQKAMPEGAYAWRIDRTTRLESGVPYPNYEVALAGEEAMKDHLSHNADWLSGEFYAASETEILRAWRAGKTAAEKYQSKEVIK
jgi:hypothetical protein